MQSTQLLKSKACLTPLPNNATHHELTKYCNHSKMDYQEKAKFKVNNHQDIFGSQMNLKCNLTCPLWKTNKLFSVHTTSITSYRNVWMYRWACLQSGLIINGGLASMLTFLRSKSRRTKTAKNLAYRLKKTQLVRHGIQEALTFSFTQRSVFIFLLAVQSKTPGWRFQIGQHFWKALFPVHTAGFVWVVGKILETDAFVTPIHLHIIFFVIWG